MTEVSHPEPSASFRPGRVVCGCDCPSRCTCFDSYGRDFVDRFLGFSRQFDPFVNFGSAFLTVLPLLLGYYHLARLGVLVGLAVSAVMFWATQISAFFVLAIQLVGRSVMLQEVAYVVVWLLLMMTVLWVHMKASNSRAIQNAQRSLHLVPQLKYHS